MNAAMIARLTDAEPTYMPPATAVLRRTCAWCPDRDDSPETNRNVSHTICPRCFAALMAQRGSH